MRDSKLNRLRYSVAAALSTGAGALILLLNSCSTDRSVVVPLQIEGATYVGDKACFDCHPNISRIFPTSPHARLRLEIPNMPGQSGCESCHGPGSKHIAMAGRWSTASPSSNDQQGPFSSDAGAASPSPIGWERAGVRAGSDKFIINPGKDPEACFQCHQEIRAEFHLPQHHPVLEGKMNCVQCHDPHGMDIMKPEGGLAMARLNESCSECHREETRPHVFEHAALREGCTVCHNPHGSINAKMLVQRDMNLCLRCHAQVQGPNAGGEFFIGNIDHTGFIHYGTCWTAGCHTAVHGSNVQPYFFY